MRHNSQGRRGGGRYRGNNSGGGNGGNQGGHRRGGGGGNNRMQVFDSNGPEVRIRGTAFQIFEKYQALAKDAASMGDRVLAESYLQHAEHYQRIIGQWNDAMPQRSDTDYRQEQTQVTESEVKTVAPGAELGLPASIVGTKQNADTALEDA